MRGPLNMCLLALNESKRNEGSLLYTYANVRTRKVKDVQKRNREDGESMRL